MTQKKVRMWLCRRWKAYTTKQEIAELWMDKEFKLTPGYFIPDPPRKPKRKGKKV